ncbi:MAG TPA: FGGY family carbohydrate kinase [Candidatus Hydrogenedentes bacterium]|nr:FGGY family carbohydrate kinase [Candidatus Hydrogenedentota bacterium]
MKTRAVAVLDVGKTNKKIRLYDRRFQPLAEERTGFDARMKDGLEIEPTEELLAWFKKAMAGLGKTYDIRAIVVCAHGATLAMLDANGTLAYPVISYTSEKGAEIEQEFYDTFGAPEELHYDTCTPNVGFANCGKALFYVFKRMPELWDKVDTVLFYNSYLGYELTGNYSMEPTYLGNHNYLWNFFDGTWSQVAIRMGAHTRFPDKMGNPWDSLGTVKPELAKACNLPEDCLVTLGIHDSNANFLPYLAKGYEKFILNSTGTWCVLMSQAPTPILTETEVKSKVFYNLDAFNRPLKTVIFPGGMEYEKFGALTSVKDESSVDGVRKVIAERRSFVVPGVMPAASAFPGVDAKVVAGGEVRLYEELEAAGGEPYSYLGQEYYAALNVSLALATRQLLERCGGEKGTAVFIEGGFANNKRYCELLAALCPDYTIALTNQAEGTAFGAALTAWMLADGLDLTSIGKEFEIETTPITPPDFGDLRGYWQAFKGFLQNE